MTNQERFGQQLQQIINTNLGDIINSNDGTTLEEKQFYCWYSSLNHNSNTWDSWNHDTGEEFPDDIYLYLGQNGMTRFLLRNTIDYLSNKILRVYIDLIKETYRYCRIDPFSDKWKSFGWIVREIDGRNFKSLKKVFLKKNFSKPLCIIAHTTKGKGVSFMENSVLWHYRSPNDFEFNLAKKELQKIINN